MLDFAFTTHLALISIFFCFPPAKGKLPTLVVPQGLAWFLRLVLPYQHCVHSLIENDDDKSVSWSFLE